MRLTDTALPPSAPASAPPLAAAAAAATSSSRLRLPGALRICFANFFFCLSVGFLMRSSGGGTYVSIFFRYFSHAASATLVYFAFLSSDIAAHSVLHCCAAAFNPWPRYFGMTSEQNTV